jgi:hypothetical protein
VLKQVNSERRELYTSYCTVKAHVITSHITYLLTRIKPADGPLLCSQYTLSRTRGVERRVVWEISTNTDLFIPNFCTHIIYIYINKTLQFQASQRSISCSVASESSEQWPWIQPQSFPRSLPQFGVLGAKTIGTLGHQSQNLKNSFISVSYDYKSDTYNKHSYIKTIYGNSGV